MTRQIHRFLGCSRAFDRHGRLGEQGNPFAQLPDKAPGVRRRIEAVVIGYAIPAQRRSEENTSELQSRMRISYAVISLKETNTKMTTSSRISSTVHTLEKTQHSLD